MNTLISKGRFQSKQGVLVAIFTILLFLFAQFAFPYAFSFEYIQIDRLIVAIVFTLFLLYLVFKGFEEYKAVDVYEHHLTIKWLFGLITIRIDKDRLRQFGLSSKKRVNYIYITTEQFDLLLNESLIDNNLELIGQLREWRIKRKDNLAINEFSKLEKKIGSISGMIISLFICAGILYSTYVSPTTTADIDNLHTVSGHLSKVPHVKRPSFRSSTAGVTFELQEYPSFRFEVGWAGYKVIHLGGPSQYGKGDAITLLITKDDHFKKLSRESEPTFNEKHFNWETVNAFDIEIRQDKVLGLEKYNQEVIALRNSNRKWGIVGIALFAFLFWDALKAFRQVIKRKQASFVY